MDRMMCVFFAGYSFRKLNCSILLECNCLNCKFGKTKEEFDNSRNNAEQILFSKGLKRVTKLRADGSQYVTVEKIDRRTDDND